MTNHSQRPLRILQLHNEHQTLGGANLVIEREHNVLTEAGHDVRSFFVESSDYLQRSKPTQLTSVIWNHEANRAVRKLIADQRTDVVHLHTPFPFMSPSVVRAAKRSNVPVVMTSHSFRIPCIVGTLRRDDSPCHDCVGAPLPLAGLRNRCYHDSFGASAALTASSILHHRTGTYNSAIDRHLALTPYMADLLVADGIDRRRVVVHPNFIPDPLADRATTGSEPPRDGAVFVGRLVDEKGIETMVEAWRLLGPDAPTLTIIGGGPERDRLEAAAPDAVRFAGEIPNTEVVDALERAQVLIFPSEWPEGLPITLIEALATRTPVLYSDIGNFTDLLDDATCGSSFTTGSPASLAETARTFFARTTTEQTKAGEAGRAYYDINFTPTAALGRLEAVYNSLVAIAGELDPEQPDSSHPKAA